MERLNFNGYSIVHPEFDKIDGNENTVNTGVIVPVYSSSSELKSVGLDSRGFRKIIFNALEKSHKELEEYYPNSIIKDQNLISYKESIKNTIQKITIVYKKQYIE